MKITIKGMEELKRAIARHPQFVQEEAQKLFMRSASFIDRFLATSPWRMGGAEGGVPFDTGNLFRNARDRKFTPYSLIIHTNLAAAPYGLFVHDGTRKMKARPYYDAAMVRTEEEREQAVEKFMDAVIDNLAR